VNILCDMTEFVTNPIRTGIQRVSFEIVSRWSGLSNLIPICMADSDDFVHLPADFFGLMKAFFQERDEPRLQEIKAQIQQFLRQPELPVLKNLSRFDRFFTPEVFFCPRRIALYQKIADERAVAMFMVVYDFLLWQHPEYFYQNAALGTWPYLKLLRSIPHLAYISEESRRVADERIFRGARPAGVTIPLGADSLGTAPPRFDSASEAFVVVSTIEPRKGHLAILRAFELLWKQGHRVPLVFVGKKGWLSQSQLEHLEKLNQEQPLFTWHANLRDPQVCEVVLSSRATIYLSQHEGYGLPPMESLALGKPVIVSPTIPSIAMIPPFGQIRLSEVTPETIQSAVLELMDDDRARQKTEEIASLDLISWDAVSRRYSDWIENEIQSQSKKPAAA
jgi:glycosyltransferase involved in cell wall biosynthesis